jgi:N-acetylmuramoyl-L-alanine amidase
MRSPARRRLALIATFAYAAVACTAVPSRPPTAGEPTLTPTTAALSTARPTFWVEAPTVGDPSPIFACMPATGAVVEGDRVRLAPPRVTTGPRRVGIQAGHWRTEEAPSEFPHLRTDTGGSWGDLREVDVTVDVARRVTDLLRQRGVVADLIPATVPPSYVADAFVAIHADADDTETARGFKIAHGTYRSPYDERLVRSLTDHYAAKTGLPWDPHVTTDMTDYYAFAWFRYQHALAPHTPAAIVELGFISYPDDRALLTEKQDVVAAGVVEGIMSFLDSVPRSMLFRDDIIVPIVRAPSGSPTPTQTVTTPRDRCIDWSP